MAKKKSKKTTTRAKIKEEKAFQILKFDLTNKQLEEFADKAATLTTHRDDIVEAKKKTVKKYTDEIKDTQNEIDRLLKCHAQKFEEKETDCIKRLNYTDKTVSYVVKGKVIETRAMTEPETQMTMATDTPRAKKKTKFQNNPQINATPEELEANEILTNQKAALAKKEKQKKTKTHLTLQ